MWFSLILYNKVPLVPSFLSDNGCDDLHEAMNTYVFMHELTKHSYLKEKYEIEEFT